MPYDGITLPGCVGKSMIFIGTQIALVKLAWQKLPQEEINA